MNAKQLEELAGQLLAGRLTIDRFVAQMASVPLAPPMFADVGEAKVDLGRACRCGFPEVVFAEEERAVPFESLAGRLCEGLEEGKIVQRGGDRDVSHVGGEERQLRLHVRPRAVPTKQGLVGEAVSHVVDAGQAAGRSTHSGCSE